MLIPNSRDLQILWEQQKKRGKIWIRRRSMKNIGWSIVMSWKGRSRWICLKKCAEIYAGSAVEEGRKEVGYEEDENDGVIGVIKN